MSQLDKLSNSEIAVRFKSLGISIGPVVPSTRRVYLRKLAKLLESGDFQATIPTQQGGKDLKKSSEAIYSTRQMPIQKGDKQSSESSSATRRRPLRPQAASTSYKPHAAVEGQDNTLKRVNASAGATSNKTVGPSKRWIPIWVQIVLALLLVFFAYIVIQTMESNPPLLTLPRTE